MILMLFLYSVWFSQHCIVILELVSLNADVVQQCEKNLKITCFAGDM